MWLTSDVSFQDWKGLFVATKLRICCNDNGNAAWRHEGVEFVNGGMVVLTQRVWKLGEINKED